MKRKIKTKNKFLVYFFVFYLILLIIPLALFALFLKKESKIILYRFFCFTGVKFLFLLGGLKIKVTGLRKGKENFVYIANHISVLDGFILSYLIGFKITPITGPSEYFDWPFSLWFEKMGFIDVQRSEFEKKFFKKANTPDQAVKKAVKELRQGQSILIFPEGYVVPEHRLSYFHTGPARISLAADKKVIPVAIINTEKIAGENIFFNPGVIEVIFGEEIDLVDFYVKNKASIKEATEFLEEKIKDLLPEKYFPKSNYEKHPEKTAVFLRLENVLYNGQANTNLVYELWRQGLLGCRQIFFLSIIYFLKHFNLLSDLRLAEISVKALKGKKVENFSSQIKKIFEKKLKYKMNEKMVKILFSHKKRGHRIVLLSNSIPPLTKCFVDFIKADYWISPHLPEDNGRYEGRIINLNPGDRLRETKNIMKIFGFNYKQSFAYGHDCKDFTWLDLFNYKTLVNPDDNLKNKALKNKIDVIII